MCTSVTDPCRSTVTLTGGTRACFEATRCHLKKGFTVPEECIHGLDRARCDICSPRPKPVVAAPVATAPRTRAPRAQSVTRTSTRRAAPLRSLTAPLDDVTVQRIYHVTHVNNLANIFGTGALLADGSSARPEVDMSAADTREQRRGISIDGEGSASVADYVPFALAPKSGVWESIITGTDDARVSAQARDWSPSDYVMLVSTVKHVVDAAAEDDELDDPAFAVTDGDAAHALTRFGTTAPSAEAVLRRLRADPDSVKILEAELLVHGSFPVSSVTLIGVANDRARDAVKAILQPLSVRTKVAVYPPWFRPAEEVAPAE
jgi:hypothetical protein